MTTPEPPDGRGERPTPPAASEHPTPPASEQPTQRVPSGSDSAATAAATPAAAIPASAAAAPVPAARGSRWGRRRTWLVAGGVVVVLLLIGGALFGIARHHRLENRWAQHGGPGHTAFHRGGHGMGPDRAFGGPGGPGGIGLDGMGPGGMGGMGPGGMGPGGRHGWGGGAMANTATLSGSVVSVANGNLVLAADGAGQVTVPTTDRTRVLGGGNGLTGLQPGQHVVVRVAGDKSAVAVVVPPARAIGTITGLTGDRATLVRVDGLTEVVELSAVNPKPANGDLVTVQGTPTDNGATLKVVTLRVLPKAS